MAEYTIKELKEKEFNKWDEFVDRSPQGTLFHKSYWLRASGEEFRIYGYFKSDELLGGLATIRRARLGIKIALHPPLTPYLGVLLRKSEARYVSRISEAKKISEALAKRMKEDFSYIRFDFSLSFIDLQPFIWEGFSSSVKYTYLLDLPDLGKIWEAMDVTRRNDIRRAEKDGIYIETGVSFEETFRLVEKTFRRQGRRARSKSAAFRYNDILEPRRECKSFLARNKKGQAIAAVYLVWDKKRSYYLLGGYDPERRHHGASAIALWEAIKFTKEKLGLNEFDFEGTMLPEVEPFFRKFGGRLTPYYSVTWSRPYIKPIPYMRKVGGEVLRRLKIRK